MKCPATNEVNNIYLNVDFKIKHNQINTSIKATLNPMFALSYLSDLTLNQ